MREKIVKILFDEDSKPYSDRMTFGEIADSILHLLAGDGELLSEISEIIGNDLINRQFTHENDPPGHDCIQECKVNLSDYVEAHNPIAAPLRSGGVKHKKCMDCWKEYINQLAIQILSLINTSHALELHAAREEAKREVIAKIETKFNNPKASNTCGCFTIHDLESLKSEQ